MHESLYVLDADGRPVPARDFASWARWIDAADRRVAKTALPGGSLVETVFLAVRCLDGDGTALFYETAVYGGALDGARRRYPDATSAREGHAGLVRRCGRGPGA